MSWKWTPEQRAAQSARMRTLNADPAFRAKREAGKRWTPEMRARRSEISRKLWADPEYRARVGGKIAASARTPEARARAGKQARRINEQRKTDPELATAWYVGICRYNQSTKKRQEVSVLMRDVHRRPDCLAHTKSMGKLTSHKKLNGRGHTKRWGIRIPKGYEDLYRTLMRRKDIRAKEALALVQEHARARAPQ